MIERLGGSVSDGVGGTPDADRKGRRCLGGGGGPLGAIEWEEARGAPEDSWGRARGHGGGGVIEGKGLDGSLRLLACA